MNAFDQATLKETVTDLLADVKHPTQDMLYEAAVHAIVQGGCTERTAAIKARRYVNFVRMRTPRANPHTSLMIDEQTRKLDEEALGNGGQKGDRIPPEV